LSEGETREYVEMRLARSGREGAIEGEKIREIYWRTGGVPRLINAVCIGVMEGRGVEEVSEELGL
jgi:type II secretory pathway predicted ATPase ExeA